MTDADSKYTVKDATEDWLAHALGGRSEKTEDYADLCNKHIVPGLWARRLRCSDRKKELTPE